MELHSWNYQIKKWSQKSAIFICSEDADQSNEAMNCTAMIDVARLSLNSVMKKGADAENEEEL